MEADLMTTGQAAKLCSVTPDTILKWIRAGRLPARKTAGGHHRISKHDLLKVLSSEHEPETIVVPHSAHRSFRYCWEYNGNGTLKDGCRKCIVYQMRALRCYDVVARASEIGHNKIYCKGGCQECDYFRKVHQQASNVLVISDNNILTASLKKKASSEPINLETADCEYSCSTVVDVFRPDYVFIDCSLGAEKVRDISSHLTSDPRIPYVRVVLAVDTGEQIPEGCDRDIFARIDKPFSVLEIVDCVNTAQEEAG